MGAIVQSLTPPPTWARKHRVLARSKFLRLLRVMSFTRESFNMAARFECTRCHGPVRLQHGSGLVQTDTANAKVNVKKDSFSLACACTIWGVK